MKENIQFWIASGIAVCCLVKTSPIQAQEGIFITPMRLGSGFVSTNLSNTSINLWEVGDMKKLMLRCSAYSGQKTSTFFITGRGGLPPSPRETVSNSEEVLVDLGKPIDVPKSPLRDRTEKRSSPAVFSTKNFLTRMPATLIEAQGWMINPHGKVTLTAQAHTIKPHSPKFALPSCHTPKTSF